MKNLPFWVFQCYDEKKEDERESIKGMKNDFWMLPCSYFYSTPKTLQKMTRFFPYIIVTKFHGIEVCFTFIPLYFLKVKYRNLRFLCPEHKICY